MNELVQLTIRQQLNELANLIEGSAWGADRGKPRIYMRSTRDRKIFFDFPDCPTGDADDVLGGARFQCYIDDCGQHPRWYQSQRSLEIKSHRHEAIALAAACYPGSSGWELAEQIMEREHDYSAKDIDDAASHLVNGRLVEAAEALGLKNDNKGE